MLPPSIKLPTVVNVVSNHLSELRELIGSVAHKCLFKVIDMLWFGKSWGALPDSKEGIVLRSRYSFEAKTS